MYHYTPIYSDGGKPVLYEDDVFKITIPLTKEGTDKLKKDTELTEREEQIFDMISRNKKLSLQEIADTLNVNERTVSRDIQGIKKKTNLKYDKKTGLWLL